MAHEDRLMLIWSRWSPRTWAIVLTLAGLLSAAAIGHLMVVAGVRLPTPLDAWHDTGERFVRDTLRLTFKTDQKRAVDKLTVYAAPLGILDPKATFVWVEALTLAAPTGGEVKAEVVRLSPARVLDPDWRPDFAKQTQGNP